MSMADKADLLRKLENNELSEADCHKLLRTPPNNPRFPETNQAKNCYSAYNEFFRCEKFKGTGHVDCMYLRQRFYSLCPNEWVERWDEQRKAGIFPGPL
mmetsp:Transcript_17232/g.33822  ORF Transcript_17232/g.33822 Transcript_17232/m.33822 type:complete len:99 (+) Transcript_17232:81-377(+)|eukprot:CAMPEP_0173416154 /NCGR_PEP_ID=MMETSP1356-20130122/85243_1 /TAXON_ID=77927 ORGANISM="Hemiselmis virescens, Strain PCC157" /NCGR_SAMPLE_ID=MMETSP1356 /ASSEMBLY_ACC=CAM_ASM_000847 /LENGTH=98 /DNA_ID=CAMNT_0014378455 /DNA_START=68 /DNA_END=364 /DNA_ORIENTATION=-